MYFQPIDFLKNVIFPFKRTKCEVPDFNCQTSTVWSEGIYMPSITKPCSGVDLQSSRFNLK